MNICQIVRTPDEYQRVLLSVTDFQTDQQDELSDLLKQHKDAETKIGAEIHPAARKQSFTPEGLEDDDRKPFFPNPKVPILIRARSVQRDRDGKCLILQC
jgi:hypothetical protein